jgi:hypothetical protein
MTAIVLLALLASAVRGQVGTGEQRIRIAAAEEQSDSNADESPTPRPKPKTKKSPSPTPHKSPTPKKKKKAAEDEDSTPTPKKKSGKKASPSPAKKKKGTKPTASPKHEDESDNTKTLQTPAPSQTPVAHAIGSPAANATPSPSAPPPPGPGSSTVEALSEEPAELTIEKTGSEKRPGFWYRFFHGSSKSGSGAGYRYLTRAVRAEIDRAPADRRNPQWQFIVVHNSGTRQGNAKVFDYYHRHVRHMQNGLAYHFVIGNGTSTGNGQIEVGDRWRRQINGGHVHSDHLNNIALGICLVGDFNRSQPTPAQLQSCEELIRYLRQRCGKVGSHYMQVKPHREMNPPRWATDCPGDAFPYSWFRRFQE